MKNTAEEEIEFLQEASGNDDLSEVTELEVIFADMSKFENYGVLQNIQKLTLIDTKMKKIANFRSIGMSLQSLMLTKQGIEKIENLEVLQNLRDLFLQKNNIQRMEGLAKCTKLRRLWLSENRISLIEGLENLVDLRELCLQGNRLTKLSGIENCTSLRILDVSRNNISKVKEIEPLIRLANLRELSFQSDTFGCSPIVFLESYRPYAICTLKQIRKLDGIEIQDQERSDSEDQFFQRALQFNDTVEALHRTHREELVKIEASRIRTIQQAEETKRRLLAQFSKLHDVVAAGREKIRREQQRQLHLREQNMEHLKSQLSSLKKGYRDLLDRLIEEEKQSMEEEEKVFAHLSRRARLELNEAVAMAEMTQGVSPTSEAIGSAYLPKSVLKRVSFQILCNESSTSSTSLSSELKALCLSIRESQQNRSDSLVIYRAVKVFNSFLYSKHVERCSIYSKSDGLASSSSEIASTHAYLAVPDLHVLKNVLVNGPSQLLKDGYLVLWSNPSTAARFAGSSSDMRGMFRVIKCTAALPKLATIEVSTAAVTSPSFPLSIGPSVESGPVKVAFPYPFVENQSSYDDVSGRQEYCIVLPASACDFVLPIIYLVLAQQQDMEDRSNQYPEYVLAQEPGLEAMLRSLSEKISATNSFQNSIPDDIAAKLSRIESKADECIKQYDDRLRQEIDPASAEQVESLERTVEGMENALGLLRGDIDKEKSSQEQLLRDFHLQQQPF